MKNTIKILGIIAIVAIVGFALISCEEPEVNPFVGTWEGVVPTLGGEVELVFTETTWQILTEDAPAVSGTYDRDDTKATLSGKMFGSETAMEGNASVNGDKMNFKLGLTIDAEFTRQ